MAAHRNNVEIKIQTQDWPILTRLEVDKSLRVMAFCAGDMNHIKQDVSFPHQSEIKVNGGEIKANLRGLKNKPGSTRPVDITSHLRLKPATYPNKVEMTYALTTKAGADVSRVSNRAPLSNFLSMPQCSSPICADFTLFFLLTSTLEVLFYGLRRQNCTSRRPPEENRNRKEAFQRFGHWRK